MDDCHDPSGNLRPYKLQGHVATHSLAPPSHIMALTVLAKVLPNTRNILVPHRPTAGPPACLSRAGTCFTGHSDGSWQPRGLSEAKQLGLADSQSQLHEGRAAFFPFLLS